MKTKSLVLLLVVLMIGCGRGDPINIKDNARRASVQISFDIPVVKVSFTKPLEETKPLDVDAVSKVIDEKIKEALQIEKELESKEKYNSYLTAFTQYGYKPSSPTFIPIGAMVPKWAKFPERVLVVCKTETKNITAWEKEYEQDVLSISEIAGVSPSQAKSIVSRLKSDGYTISKDSISPNKSVELIWFRSGWDDAYPEKLNWKVTKEAEDENRIKGYDPRGILEISTVGDDSRVNVTAGYFDLKDEFKPKSSRIEELEKEIEDLKKELEDAKDKLLKKEKPEKRDITKVTNIDIMLGEAKLEWFTFKNSASGIFLGNMKVRDKLLGYQWEWFSEGHTFFGETKGVILTNAHVAEIGTEFSFYVSKDKERMYIVFPGHPYVRYTQDSDTDGTPAQVLYYDNYPVMSWDYDCAIMVTSSVPQYQQYSAKLGNSDKIKEGDPVVMVGNPMLMQKFTTEGIVSNTNYSLMKSSLVDEFIESGLPRKWFNWLSTPTIWVDTPIGIGGTSGSGVWAINGSEAGKVISLHNCGMVSGHKSNPQKKYKVSSIPDNLIPEGNALIKDSIKKLPKKFFSERISIDGEFIEDAGFSELISKHSSFDVSGMNGGIPINKVKQYLQERGLNPDDFGWQGLDRDYWLR